MTYTANSTKFFLSKSQSVFGAKPAEKLQTSHNAVSIILVFKKALLIGGRPKKRGQSDIYE